MSLLGKFNKQPIEVEIYPIQFAEDMSATDELTGMWQMISRKSAAAWDQVVQTTTYAATLADAERIIVTTADVTLPLGAPEGYRLYVSNHGIGSFTVGAFTVLGRGATVVAYTGGVWVEEAKTTAVLVTSPGDQRVRTSVYGGVDKVSYKIQVCVTTAEGRTMQDEFQINVKEV